MARLYLIAAVTSFLTSLIATPFSILLAKRLGAIDGLDPRKVHLEPRPRWGGIGIMAGFFAAISYIWFSSPELQKLLDYSRSVSRKGKTLFTLNLGDQFIGILIGTTILFIVGLVDDKRGVKPGMKLLFQIIAAYVAMTYGVRIYGLSVPGFEAYSLFPLWLMQIATIVWLVGLTNAVNLIDGLDGLAGGIVAIIAGAFLAVTLIQESSHSAFFIRQMRLAGIIAAALLGGTAGFLIYNFHPARVFMGDCGSLSVGFLVACVAVIGAFKTTVLAVLLVPIVLAAVPLTDMVIAFARRLFNKQNPFSPDRGHLHHRLLDAGWTQREVVFMVYTFTLVLAFVSVTIVALKK